MRSNHGLLVILLGFVLLITSCHSHSRKREYVIGLSQCMLDDAWRQIMIREVEIEASMYDDVRLEIRNADTNNKQQIEQIRELIDMGVDVLIISPNESEPLTPVAEEAFRAGIPTVITDRKINSELYTTFVGANNYEIGRDAGRYASRYLQKGAVVLEIWGLSTSSPAQERHIGFTDALIGRSDLSFVKLEGEWRYDTTSVRIARKALPEKIDFVYAHNDMMAIAAREFFLRQDSIAGQELHIIGVDAVPGAGLQAVSDGRINTSFLYPTGGEQVIKAAMKILQGDSVPRYIPLSTSQVNADAARTSVLQSERIETYQQQIEAQRSRLDGMFTQYHFLQDSLLIISILMIGFVGLTGYVFFINRKIRLTNRALREINRKEEEQRQKLIALNAEIKEVTAQKLQFFTNVSHEVRTPLTLILSPLDRLIGLMQQSPYLPDLQLIRKNADRLLRVINQMLDFRKIENDQEELKIRSVDLVSFTREVMSYFDSMAQVRQIRYRLIAENKNCTIWIDTDQMEKVLVNLLSNAFKFTPEKGSIEVLLQEAADHVLLQVKDSGAGIKPENQTYLFNRFYTEHRAEGTGIGLHLAKQYIQMHSGEIAVESVVGLGSTFTVKLKKGKAHFLEKDVEELLASPGAYEATHLNNEEVLRLLEISYPYTILITEDDEEVRAYLEKELGEQFRVLTATNGKEALRILEAGEEISLVLSDVMMPEMNGFELCRSIKTNLSYSHIPVILLTALTDERQRLYGVSRGADGYIQKPFDIRYVKVKIIRLLEEQKRMREQLLRTLQENRMLIREPEKAEHIDDQFLRRLLARLEDVYTDSDFNVERLSDTLGLSRGHLHRKVKELTGTSPVDFLRNYRLSKAAELLRLHKFSISEVAYQTGFSSPAYFSKCFKAVYGVMPKEY